MDNQLQIQLHNDDCLNALKKIPSCQVDLILTDPPYGTTNLNWDLPIQFEDMWKELNRILKPNGSIVLFGDEPFSSRLRLSNKNYKYDLIWEKEAPTNFFQLKRRPGKVTEFIHVFYNGQNIYNPQKVKHDGKPVKNKPAKSHQSITTGLNNSKITPYTDDGYRYPSNILRFNRIPRGKTLHPTQKPIDLLEWLIKTYSNEGQVVLDFTMGSGSTGVAAVRNNRNFIGIELNTDYFNIAKNRIDMENKLGI